ncbi:MAG: hypothetical protein NZ949_06690 [Candidatus Kapabacteria bacterium]|nr:hypothetical protein [Candidatus Kapabacteria bacterium]MDW7996868.1 hypothetical protein [Bacteroidota bacterium]
MCFLEQHPIGNQIGEALVAMPLMATRLHPLGDSLIMAIIPRRGATLSFYFGVHHFGALYSSNARFG